MDARDLDELMWHRYAADPSVTVDRRNVDDPEAGNEGHGVNTPDEMDVGED
jgi:hypothetical protein